MTYASYFLNRFFSQIVNFLKHWYVNSFYFFSHFLVSVLENLDRFFALKVTFKHLFQPLYQDRTFIGYTLGFFFRLLRIILSLIIYTIINIVMVLIYTIWLLIPPFIIFKIFGGQWKLKI
jgi:hypothetical protein